jgi:hypothetical protein
MLQRKRSNTTTPRINAHHVEAWEIVTTTDPLVDSDDEYADDHVRIDCRE